MFRSIASTTSAIYAEIRAAIRESVLVVLSPGQVAQQHCTMVLITVRRACALGSEDSGGNEATGGLYAGLCERPWDIILLDGPYGASV